MDDSVVRDSGEMLRRSRGCSAPDAIALPRIRDAADTFVWARITKTRSVWYAANRRLSKPAFRRLSDNDGIEAQWREALRLIQSIYDFTRRRIVCDAHPGYVSVSGPVRCVCRQDGVTPSYAAACGRAWLAAGRRRR